MPFVLRWNTVPVDSGVREMYFLIRASYISGIIGGEMVDELFCKDLVEAVPFLYPVGAFRLFSPNLLIPRSHQNRTTWAGLVFLHNPLTRTTHLDEERQRAILTIQDATIQELARSIASFYTNTIKLEGKAV